MSGENGLKKDRKIHPISLRDERQGARRLAFAHTYQQWRRKVWRQVVFSDKAWFQLFENRGKKFMRRRPGAEYKPECMQPLIKYHPKLTAWGTISAASKSKLVFTKKNIDAHKIHRYFFQTS